MFHFYFSVLILFLLPLSIMAEGISAGLRGFIENKGQISNQNGRRAPEVLFLANMPSMKIHVRKNGFSYEKIMPGNIRDSVTVSTYRTDILLSNSLQPEVVPEDKSPYHFNYYLGHTPVNGITDVRGYSSIRLKNIYKGIDLLLNISDGEFKYSFIVKAGGNVSDIKMVVQGAEGLQLDMQAGLVIKTPAGNIIDSRPFTFQMGNEQLRKEIPSRFIIHKNDVSFTVGAYDVTKELVIDPSVVWGTYFGGTAADKINSIAVDLNNNILTTGKTASSTYIASTGAHQVTYMGQEDAFVTKFDTAGQLLWATYIGGTGQDIGLDITADDSNQVYMSGISFSTTGIATPGVFLTINSSGGKGMIEKFDSIGQRIWGTYTVPTYHYGIAIDANHDILVCGSTSATSGVSTPGTQQQNLVASSDGVLLKFNAAGQRIWGTYYGSTYIDRITGVVTDSHRNIYLCGWSNSHIGLGTPGTHRQSMPPITDGTAFLAKFTPDGVRVWGTYYGCTTDNSCESLTLVGDTAIYFTGVTLCASGVATPGVYLSTFPGGYARYIARFDTTGNLTWGTYVVQTQSSDGHKISHDSEGNVCVEGIAYNISSFPTADAIQLTAPTYDDGYIAIINQFGQKVWASFIGGPDGGVANSAVFDHNDDLIVAGYSNGPNAIGTPGTYQPTTRGNDDGYVLKISRDCARPEVSGISGDSAACPNSNNLLLHVDSTLASYNSIHWQLPLSFSSANLNRDTLLFGVDTVGGRITTFLQNGCKGYTIITREIIVDSVAIGANITGETSYCTGDTIQLQVANNAGSEVQWLIPGGITDSVSLISFVADTSKRGSFMVRLMQNGCIAADTAFISVEGPVDAYISGDSVICAGAPATLTAHGGGTYLWSSGHGVNSISVFPTSATSYQVTVSSNGCVGIDSLMVNVISLPVVNLGNDTSLCPGASTIVDAGNAGADYLWQNNLTTQTISVNQSGNYWVKVFKEGCTSSDTIQVGYITAPFDLGNDTTVCSPNHLVLGSIVAGATYHWQDNSTSPYYTVYDSGFYSLTVELSGCVFSDTTFVAVYLLSKVTAGVNPAIICASDSAEICGPAGYLSYHWNIGATTMCLNSALAGNYYVTVTDNQGCTASSNPASLNVFPTPAVSISENNDTLTAYDAVSYQWYLNGNAIPNATSAIYIAGESGNYNVEITDSNGCTAISNPVNIVTDIQELVRDENFAIYPNPITDGNWQLEVGGTLIGSTAEVFDNNGRLVYKATVINLRSEIDLKVSQGVYWIRISSFGRTSTRKLVRL